MLGESCTAYFYLVVSCLSLKKYWVRMWTLVRDQDQLFSYAFVCLRENILGYSLE